jgi:hypothetical protein
MNSIRLYHAADSVWLGVEIKGRVFLISWVGRVGDCVSPGSPRLNRIYPKTIKLNIPCA